MALEEWEGHPVEACSVKITKAGDGLSSELSVAPVAIRYGDEVFYVLHGKCSGVGYDVLPKKLRTGALVLADEDAMVREHEIETLAITQVSREDVERFITEAALRVARAQEDLTGTLRLAVDPDDAVAHQSNHDAGLHAEPTEGCPECYPDLAAVTAQGKAKRGRGKGSGG